MPKLIDHLEAIAGLTMPDDLEHLPPARLRRIRDSAYVLQKCLRPNSCAAGL